MSDVLITLTIDEGQQAWDLARDRIAWHRRRMYGENFENFYVGDINYEKAYANTIGAEIAAGRYLCLKPDLRTGCMPPGDLIMPNNAKIDVKHTFWPHGNLLVETKKARPARRCKYYLLVTGEMPHMWLRGYAYDCEVFLPDNIKQGKLIELPGGRTKQGKPHHHVKLETLRNVEGLKVILDEIREKNIKW